MAINILDTMIINRISAGEVVESPFSIVKELLDNSLDAGADKISIDILNGGIDLISIQDNGKGIERDDIVKAFLPHATSKISSLEDLDSIATLGFRGEALASISNVSQTTMVTKTASEDCAYSIDVNGGVFSDVTITQAKQGTRIDVKNLFFNTPARRKFLKKPKQEENQITNIIARYIMANPSISFKYTVDGKMIYQSNGGSLLDAIYCVYGLETTQNLMSIDKSLGDIRLTGYVSKIGFSKPNTTYQTLIINNRYVIDETVSKAVYMANEEYLMTRQFPFYVLSLNMPNEDVDVNVHPSKMNIKFANPSKIYDLVYTAVRGAIYKAISPQEPVIQADTSSAMISSALDSMKEIEIEPVKQVSAPVIELRQTTYTPLTMFDLKQDTATPASHVVSEDISISDNAHTTSTEHLKDVSIFTDYNIVGEIFNEFIVLEKGDNMILIDFHAGHERLNYDKFVSMIESRDIVIQDLLIPYTHELSKIEIGHIMELKDELNKLGFDIDTFGDNKIIIYSVPMQLKDINLKEFINDLIHDMKNLKPKMNSEISHYLAKKACKSSVKSGMKLSEMEIHALLKDLDMKNPILLCPHGRPVITVVTKNQIEKWFKRIV